MKILILSAIYQDASINLEKILDEKSNVSYKEKKYILEKLGYAYDKSGWCDALNNSGYCADYIIVNVKNLQKTWAKENLLENTYSSFEDIVIKQIKIFNPNVLWYILVNDKLLRRIREECPQIKLIIGWTGSAIVKNDQWKYIDVVLSCAQESVNFFIKNGLSAIQIHHAFNPKMLTRVSTTGLMSKKLVFIGQLIRNSEFHLKREHLLVQLLDLLDIDIYSPSANIDYIDVGKYLLKKSIYDIVNLLKFDDKLKRWSLLNRIIKWNDLVMPVNMKLRKQLKRPIFGQVMFNVLYNSEMVLNVHADSSPQYASNMRMFEATGMGSCLITDWKKNVNELFSSNEIITYVSVEDCVDKIKWLRNNPDECKKIAKAGQKRCLKDHLYKNRVDKFMEIIHGFI